MKVGDEVAVCYDGKIGRWSLGKVLEESEDDFLISFFEWANEESGAIKAWFFPTENGGHGAYVDVEDSFMKNFFGFEGDWYSVYDIEEARNTERPTFEKEYWHFKEIEGDLNDALNVASFSEE